MAGQRPLLERAAAGDREAFARLYEDQVEGVYRYLLAWTGDRAAAEDLPGQLGRLGAVAGPGQQVAVDALDLVLVEARERLPVAGGGPFEQGTLARHLGGHVAVPARAGDPLGVPRSGGSGCHGGPSAA